MQIYQRGFANETDTIRDYCLRQGVTFLLLADISSHLKYLVLGVDVSEAFKAHL